MFYVEVKFYLKFLSDEVAIPCTGSSMLILHKHLDSIKCKGNFLRLGQELFFLSLRSKK